MVYKRPKFLPALSKGITLIRFPVSIKGSFRAKNSDKDRNLVNPLNDSTGDKSERS